MHEFLINAIIMIMYTAHPNSSILLYITRANVLNLNTCTCMGCGVKFATITHP